VYGGGRIAPESRLFLSRLESPGSTPLAMPHAVLFAVSPTADLAVGLDPTPISEGFAEATLVQVPMLGGATRRLADRVRFGDWHASGLAIVRVVGSRQRLEYPIGTVLFESDGEIGVPRISPGGDQVAFLEWPVKDDDRGTVAVVNRAGVKRTISRAWEGVRSLAWRPGGEEVWYSAADISTNYSIWAATMEGVERRVLSGPEGLLILDFNRDGRALVAHYARATLVRAVTAGESVEQDLTWMNASFARDVTPDGRRILLSYNGESSSPSYDVFVRDRDADPVRIGIGQAQQFSPDGRFALSVVHGPPTTLEILPVAAGDRRVVSTGPVTPVAARWMPDGQRLVVIGTEAGKGQRAYVVGTDGSGLRAISPEGITVRQLVVSRDGAFVALRSPDGRYMLYPTGGGEPRPIEGLTDDEAVLGWSGDGRAALVGAASGPIRRVVRVDPATGRRETVRDITPPEGLRGPSQVMLTPDGRTMVANFGRVQMKLFLVEGLR
jgi:dipeptidyl aminopeptidase/acylaminoacyl peptidase